MTRMSEEHDFPYRAETAAGTEIPSDGSDHFLAAERTSVLICAEADASASGPHLTKLAEALGHRVLDCVPLAWAHARLAGMVDVDVVILSCSGLEPEVEPLIARLGALAQSQAARLIVIVDLVGLDRVHALLETSDVTVLCEPRPEDVQVALGQAVPLRLSTSLNDSGREEGRDRFDRVTDQLMRLNRMVETLVQHREPDALTLGPDASAAAAAPNVPVRMEGGADNAAEYPISGRCGHCCVRAGCAIMFLRAICSRTRLGTYCWT
mgnify:FL=1